MIEARQNRLETKVNLLLAIGVLQAIIGLAKLFNAPTAGTAPTAQTQSVKIGEHAPINAPSDHAEFLTVKQAAEQLGISERTLITAIAEDRVLPEPTRNGRAWMISPNFRYQPPSVANSSN